jgi:tight adherence protein C
MNTDVIVNTLRDLLDILVQNEMLSSPFTFGGLIALTVVFIWLALRPSKSDTDQEGRLEGYVRGTDIIEDLELSKSFLQRAIIPAIRRVLSALSSMTPMRDVARIDQQLIYAGEPGGLTAPDVLGLQILAAALFSGIYFGALLLTDQLGTTRGLIVARNAGLLIIIGYVAPRLWLRAKADARKREILRKFPDALDLLSVSVDAGLALDTAMVRVCERWDNAMTEEFNRTLLELRVGTPRDQALQRMANRTGVQDVQTFVGVLIQSTQLGTSIAETLHTQAAQVRVRRRQRAEEQARQASIKMIFALVFLIFPALLVVLLGPGIPRILQAVGTLGG